eukprot:Skav216460  [mRNA]  locus=scaffold50:792755:798495:+ [translate_table: standard]
MPPVPLSISKAVMVGTSRGFRSTSSSSRHPAGCAIFQSFRMEYGSLLIWLDVIRSFSNSLLMPMSSGSETNSLKDRNSFLSRFSSYFSGNVWSRLWERFSSRNSLHCINAEGTELSWLYDRSAYLRAFPLVRGKSLGNTVRRLWDKLITSKR